MIKVIKFLFLYLLLSPINWLPFVHTSILVNFKVALFIITFFLLLYKHPKIVVPYGFKTMFSLLILSTFFGLMNGVEGYVPLMKGIFLSILTLILFININKDKEDLLKILYQVSVVISVIAAVSIFANLTGSFDIQAPKDFFGSEGTFAKTGFGGVRTGYSNNLFLFIPIILYYSKKSPSHRITLLRLTPLLILITAQTLSGGRAGLIASILAIMFFQLRNVKTFFISIIFLSLTIFFLPKEFLIETFRAEKLEDGNQLTDDAIDDLSSGRTSGYKEGFEMFLEKPILGWGFDLDKAQDMFKEKIKARVEIHNLWLKSLVYGGIFYFTALISLFVYLFYTVSKSLNNRIDRAYENQYYLFLSMFMGCLFISMVEPNFLIGSYQASAFFWIITGVVLKKD